MECCTQLIGASDWLWASLNYRDSKANKATNTSMFCSAYYPVLENDQNIWGQLWCVEVFFWHLKKDAICVLVLCWSVILILCIRNCRDHENSKHSSESQLFMSQVEKNKPRLKISLAVKFSIEFAKSVVSGILMKVT